MSNETKITGSKAILGVMAALYSFSVWAVTDKFSHIDSSISGNSEKYETIVWMIGGLVTDVAVLKTKIERLEKSEAKEHGGAQ
ncbi:hypothetical protein WCX49_11720 [Sulfurimonas sp. HSL-1656]|uniref:hypothetical protein n=1 Tax=Thiomicrolovo subterrani TaxID=3131934 RepID=UPI0031F9C6F9